MWIDTTTFPPCKPNLKKIRPPAALRPGRRRGRGSGVAQASSSPRTRLFGAASPPPGAQGLCTFLRREKGLRLFFQFSVPSINKPLQLAAFGPAQGGPREGLGRGEGFAPVRRKCELSLPGSCLSRGCRWLRGNSLLLGRGRPHLAGHPRSNPGESPELPRAPEM